VLQSPQWPLPDPQHLGLPSHDSNGKPLEAAAGKLSESKKPYKKSEGNKGMAFMQSMFKAYVIQCRRKPVSLRSVRNVTMTPVTVPTVNRNLELGTANTGFSVHRRLKIDKPLGTIYLSCKPHPIKIANTALIETTKADEIAIKTPKTGKVTAVVTVMSILSYT
jgi:hypothetical protein